MPTLEALAEEHYRQQQTLARRVARRLAVLWRRINPNRIAGSWHEQIGLAHADLALAQANAAAAADPYIQAALAARGVPAEPAGRVNPVQFSRSASDGRNLTDLLNQPAITTLTAIRDGAPTARALAQGLIKLQTIATTQVGDAGRVAEETAMAARPEVKGYVRMLNLPSCARCIIMAGRWYRWDTGFLRHPNCDCRTIPMAEHLDDTSTNPMQAFNWLSREEQDRTFTKAGAEAIRLGADISKVVNARRGMYEAHVFGRTVKATNEGVKGRKKRRVRLMPEQIFIEAKGEREEAIRLLRLHGYLV